MYATTSAKKTQAHVAALHEEINALQNELGVNENADTIVKTHIKLLHQYNEAKDATQILIGRLATARGSTIKQIHEEYDLKDCD